MVTTRRRQPARGAAAAQQAQPEAGEEPAPAASPAGRVEAEIDEMQPAAASDPPPGDETRSQVLLWLSERAHQHACDGLLSHFRGGLS